MKILKLLLPIYLGCATVGFSQPSGTLPLTHICHAEGIESRYIQAPYILSEPSEKALLMLEHIMKEAGAKQNFEFKRADIDYVLATTIEDTRFVFYSPSFLNKTERAGTFWSAYFLLAHAIGHHLKKHDFEITDPYRIKYNELDADVFAGAALRALGATLAEAIHAVDVSPMLPQTDMRPSKASRMEAMILGWNRHNDKIGYEGPDAPGYPVAVIFHQLTGGLNLAEQERARLVEAERERALAAEAARKEQERRIAMQSRFGSAFGNPGHKSSGNEGIPTGTGDNPFAQSNGTGAGAGGGEGTGTGFSIGGGLVGRKVVQRGSINDNSQKTGKVVINVCVDSKGSVTSAEYTPRGSTTADSDLRTKAIQAARGFRFAASTVNQQCGAITFNFQIKELPPIPATTSSTPTNYSAQNTYTQMPDFPWPPPNCHKRKTLVKNLHTNTKAQYFSDIDNRLQRALDAQGYFQRSYYKTPGGFAIATQMEQFEEDGKVKSRYRWEDYPVQDDFAGLWDYFKSLVMPDPGRFRVFVFVVTDRPYKQGEKKISPDAIRGLATSGFSEIPAQYSTNEITDAHNLEVLVYEFEAPQSTKKCMEKCTGGLDVQTHLSQSGLANIIGF